MIGRYNLEFLPPLHLGVANAWLLLAVYFIGLTASALAFPEDKRKKLFLEPHYPRRHPRWVIIGIGRIAAIAYVALTLFSPLRLGTVHAYIGIAIYLIGYAVVMISLQNYRQTPTNKLVTSGLYRFSRNPQWLGLVGVFVGTALAIGGWLHFLLLFVLASAYHFQILLEEEICRSMYGVSYNDYMERIPRYLSIKIL
jgi:protein-S-isoprenylcysteine O-methyltransferase Ste14